jgi:hypothetical protein
MHSRYRWRGRRGKTLCEAVDALIVNTGHQDQFRPAFETSTREAALRTAVVYRTHAKELKAESEQDNTYAHPEYGTRIEWADGKVEEL